LPIERLGLADNKFSDHVSIGRFRHGVGVQILDAEVRGHLSEKPVIDKRL
jgi:hypothetical protein